MEKDSYIENLRLLIKKQGFSLKEISNKIEMTEAGFHRALTKNTLKVSSLIKIGGILNIPIEDFFTFPTGNKNRTIQELKIEKQTLEYDIRNNKNFFKIFMLENTSAEFVLDFYSVLNTSFMMLDKLITENVLYNNLELDITNGTIGLYECQLQIIEEYPGEEEIDETLKAIETEYVRKDILNVQSDEELNESIIKNRIKELKINTFKIDLIYSEPNIREVMNFHFSGAEKKEKQESLYYKGWELYGKYITSKREIEVLNLFDSLIKKETSFFTK
jgi:transcriptional regulator with XRE-family HTH domain